MHPLGSDARGKMALPRDWKRWRDRDNKRGKWKDRQEKGDRQWMKVEDKQKNENLKVKKSLRSSTRGMEINGKN